MTLHDQLIKARAEIAVNEARLMLFNLIIQRRVNYSKFLNSLPKGGIQLDDKLAKFAR